MKKKQTLEEKDGHCFLSPPRPQKKCRQCRGPRTRHSYLCENCLPKPICIGSVEDIINTSAPIGTV